MNNELRDQIRTDLPEMSVGDTIKLYYKFTEKDKKRVQAFEGVIISRRGAGISENMTLRGPAAGVMMEKIIPVHSPNIDKVETIKRGKVRRSKLYYLRDVVGKKAKLKRRIEKPSASIDKE
ncbi:MAG: 50S ribosomal protein L19 [Candidatus Pacebacteria bacterium]|nr:50S ribosomal protein L19 [Candidatus Paceibacterota bacterium]